MAHVFLFNELCSPSNPAHLHPPFTILTLLTLFLFHCIDFCPPQPFGFPQVCSSSPPIFMGWGDGSKLKEGRLRLDIRKKFFTMKVVKHWSRLPREAVAAPSLEVFKAGLHGPLSNLIWWKVYTAHGRDWN